MFYKNVKTLSDNDMNAIIMQIRLKQLFIFISIDYIVNKYHNA